MKYLLILFLLSFSLSVGIEEHYNNLNLNEVILKIIPPPLIDLATQLWNTIVAHTPQITNAVQKTLDAIDFAGNVKDLVDNIKINNEVQQRRQEEEKKRQLDKQKETKKLHDLMRSNMDPKKKEELIKQQFKVMEDKKYIQKPTISQFKPKK